MATAAAASQTLDGALEDTARRIAAARNPAPADAALRAAGAPREPHWERPARAVEQLASAAGQLEHVFEDPSSGIGAAVRTLRRPAAAAGGGRLESAVEGGSAARGELRRLMKALEAVRATRAGGAGSMRCEREKVRGGSGWDRA